MPALPNHPHVTYEAEPQEDGTMLLVCACSACGATWRHLCTDPKRRLSGWLLKFGITHGHGLRPVRQG